jgi:hypothetical protein
MGDTESRGERGVKGAGEAGANVGSLKDKMCMDGRPRQQKGNAGERVYGTG